MKWLTELAVSEIKRAIWEGAYQTDVARRAQVTQTTVSRIVRGEQWRDVRWPDGSTGALSAAQRGRIRLLRATRNISPLADTKEDKIAQVVEAVASAEEDQELVAVVSGRSSSKSDLLNELLKKKGI